MVHQSVVGAYKMDPQIREQLWNYFEARREPLWHAIVDCEDSIRKQKETLIQLANEITESELGKGLHHYLQVDNALRYGHLIAVCSVLENSVKFICKLLDPQYDGQQVEKKYRGRGNWLAKHLLHLTDNNLIAPDVEISKIADELNQAITLRNCVGHAWGNIAEHRYPAEVRNAILHLETNDSNCDFASESKDGHLLIEDDFIPHVFNQGEELIRLLLKIE